MRRPDGVYQSQSASNDQLFPFEIDNSDSYTDVNECLQAKKQLLKFIIKEQITFQGTIKTNLFLECEMINAVGEVQLCKYKTANAARYHAGDINEHLKKSFAKIIREIEINENVQARSLVGLCMKSRHWSLAPTSSCLFVDQRISAYLK
jgi:hypothetical protein